MPTLSALDDCCLSQILRPEESTDSDLARAAQVGRAFQRVVRPELQERRRLRDRCLAHGLYYERNENAKALKTRLGSIDDRQRTIHGLTKALAHMQDLERRGLRKQDNQVKDGYLIDCPNNVDQVMVRQHDVTLLLVKPSGQMAVPLPLCREEAANLNAYTEGLRAEIRAQEANDHGNVAPILQYRLQVAQGGWSVNKVDLASSWIVVESVVNTWNVLSAYDATCGRPLGTSTRTQGGRGTLWAVDEGGVTAIRSQETRWLTSSWTPLEGWRDGVRLTSGLCDKPCLPGAGNMPLCIFAQSRARIFIAAHCTDTETPTHAIYWHSRDAFDGLNWQKLTIDTSALWDRRPNPHIVRLAANERFLAALFASVPGALPQAEFTRTWRYHQVDLSETIQSYWSAPLARPSFFLIDGGWLYFSSGQRGTLRRLLDQADIDYTPYIH